MDIFQSAEVGVELRPGRHVRLLHHRADNAKAKVLFCHGSMASMLQYRSNIEYVINRGDCDVLAYDWLGCGGSAKPRDWNAYSTPNLLKDLEAAYSRMLAEGSKGAPAILIGHSFGTSLVVELDAVLRANASRTLEETPLQPPEALFLIATCDGRSLKNAAANLFRLPEFALRWLQPTMTAGFAQMALHPDTSQAIREEAVSISEANEMHVCKAFYRQLSWCTAETASAAGPALCIHGDGDGLIPVENGRLGAAQLRRAAFHVLGPASHQVMSEKPQETNALLGTLINNVNAGCDVLQGFDLLDAGVST
eukprot:TRINITY_DN113660_c0_g1_i1.p1 TRINITY_DN113660_c0_g1~~TRINITY_DN113660_c0_g1_i1.p1  ORF type:complete len:319 (+),score=44.24 TRINITY_DN113660_c0_g1_i1:33-959(+)